MSMRENTEMEHRINFAVIKW